MQSIFRQILMDHYQNPRNKGLSDDADFVTVHLKNPSCGDDLTIQVKMAGDGEHIEKIRQEGSGCSICCSSASIMTELLQAKTITEAEQLIDMFKAMVTAEPFDEEALGEAVALQGVAKLQPRVKCATLGWVAMGDALEKITDEQKGANHG